MTPHIAQRNFRGSGWMARQGRRILGGLIAVGAALLALGAAAVAAFAAVAMVGMIAMLGGLLFLFSRLRLRRPARSAASAATGASAGADGVTLDARRTASGWTVDAMGRFS